MKNYQTITKDGKSVNHSTIRGLKLAIRRKKISEGTFVCVCPSGNIHIWTIITKEFTCRGRTVKKATVGKGVNKINTVAKLVDIRNRKN